MKKAERINLYREVLSVFGSDHQKLKLAEELNEAAAVIVKGVNEGKESDDLYKELADLTIVVEQVPLLYSVVRLEREKEYKLKRLAFRIENNKV